MRPTVFRRFPTIHSKDLGLVLLEYSRPTHPVRQSGNCTFLPLTPQGTLSSSSFSLSTLHFAAAGSLEERDTLEVLATVLSLEERSSSQLIADLRYWNSCVTKHPWWTLSSASFVLYSVLLFGMKTTFYFALISTCDHFSLSNSSKLV